MPQLIAAESFQDVLAKLPGTGELFRQLCASLWQLPQLPSRSLELCRLRLAQLHRSEAEWQRCEVALDENCRSALAHWQQSPLFSAPERACLAFAEVYAMDAQAITDELAAAVRQFHGDAGLVALIEALGLFDGCIRLSLLWHLSAPAAGCAAE